MVNKKVTRIFTAVLTVAIATSCMIGSTFAKYVTEGSEVSDSARVAYWGFTGSEAANLNGLFSATYGTTVTSADNDDVIAPGTAGTAEAAFGFEFTDNDNETATAPEVAYSITVDVESEIDDAIKNNPDIEWKLDDGEFGTFDAMIAGIKALSGDASGTKQYAPGQLPEGFADGETHTIAWQWTFEDDPQTDAQDVVDTAMGNKATLDDVSIAITVSAVQVD